MERQQNIAQSQEKFIIKLDDDIAKTLPESERKKLLDAYMNLFSGFSWVNWTNKYSLGRAWQTALTQCGTFIETKNKKNPAARYLSNVYNSHKKYWSKVIMTSATRENTIDQNDEKIKQMRVQGEHTIQTAMDIINLVLARYNEHIEEQVIATANRATELQKQTHTMTSQAQLPQHHQSAKPVSGAKQVSAQPRQHQPDVKPALNIVSDGVAVQKTKTPVSQTIPQATKKPLQASVKSAIAPVQKPAMIKENIPQNVPQIMPAKQVHTPAKKVTKTPVKQQPISKKPDLRATFAVAEMKIAKQSIELDQAKLKMHMQRKIQIWAIGQQNQKAA